MSDLWERLCKANESNMLSVDGEVATKAFMEGMPEDLRSKTIGDEKALGELGQYRKDFNYRFGSTVGTNLASHVKQHEEINECSLGFTTPDGVGMHVDFARPTDKDADTETWGLSFSHRQSLNFDDRLTSELRSSIGNLFTAEEADGE